MVQIATEFDGELQAKESYVTIKRRLLDAGDFIEVTSEGRRILINKRQVQGVIPTVITTKKAKKK